MSSSYAVQKDLILIADPRILLIPIINSKEEMIDLKHFKEIAYGPSPEIPNNNDYTKIRKTIYEKLIQAQKLLPAGLHFCIYEGYRSIQLQKKLFDTRYADVKKDHPDWLEKEIFYETIKMISPVINLDGSKNIPPHSTGGAIDIYLINDKGEPIDMGIHPEDWMSDKEGSISLTASSVISNQAQVNREIMSEVLSIVGFVNYPGEYWHWSYGDRYWAYFKGKTHAIYGSY